MIEFVGVAGSSCGALLPTGNTVDEIDGVPTTMIDNGMPVVVMAAESFGISGHESIADLEANTELKQKVESIRLQAGHLMNLGDVTDKTVPKMALVSKSKNGYMINTRCFIPHRVHESVGVLAAVSIATAGAIPGSTAFPFAKVPSGNPKMCDVEHPTGKFTVAVDGDNDSIEDMKVSVVRTARMLFDGKVFIPSVVWDGN
jgi:4-oxalomesaconate tautomerase